MGEKGQHVQDLVVAALPDVVTVYRPCPEPAILSRGGWTIERPRSGWVLSLEVAKVDADFGVHDGSVVLCDEPTAARLERLPDPSELPRLSVGEVLVPRWTPAGPWRQRVAWADASERRKDRTIVVVESYPGEDGQTPWVMVARSSDITKPRMNSVPELLSCFDRDPALDLVSVAA